MFPNVPGKIFSSLKNGAILTPPPATILEGITRDSVMTIARDFGYSVNEGMIARDMLYTADEVFLTGSAAEVNAITSVDRRTIGSGMIGPVTAELRAAFIRTIRGKGTRSVEWCDYI